MADQWFIQRNGKKFGPMPTTKLKHLATTGKLKPTDLVHKEGMNKFVHASAVKGLFPAVIAPSMTPPAPLSLDDDSSPVTLPQPLSLDDDDSLVSEGGEKRTDRLARNSGKVPWVWFGIGSAGIAAVILVVVITVVGKKEILPPSDSGQGTQVASSASQLTPLQEDSKSGNRPVTGANGETSKIEIKPVSGDNGETNKIEIKPVSGDNAQADADARIKREYTRFAALCSMEQSGNKYLEQTRKVAPESAKLLESSEFTDPALRKAATNFGRIAFLYELSWRLEWDSLWKPEEQAALLKKWFDADDDKKERDFLLASLGGTLNKVRKAEAAVRVAFQARTLHSQLWKEILPVAKRFGGAGKDTLPVRFGTGWVRNAYGKPLTNLTLAIQTNASTELPDDARLHVIFVENLDPDASISIPGWLISKLWKGQKYVPTQNCFSCSIWSDEVRIENVAFDLRLLDQIKEGGGFRTELVFSQGFFPDSNFKGKYDTSTPWIYISPKHNASVKLAPPTSHSIGLGGPWLMLSGESNGDKLPEEIVKAARMFVKDKYMFDVGNTSITGRCEFNPKKTPFEINLSEIPSPEQKKTGPGVFFQNSGPTWLGICKLEDDVFTVCLAPPGKERPKEFKTKSGSGEILYIWERWKRRKD